MLCLTIFSTSSVFLWAATSREGPVKEKTSKVPLDWGLGPQPDVQGLELGFGKLVHGWWYGGRRSFRHTPGGDVSVFTLGWGERQQEEPWRSNLGVASCLVPLLRFPVLCSSPCAANIYLNLLTWIISLLKTLPRITCSGSIHAPLAGIRGRPQARSGGPPGSGAESFHPSASAALRALLTSCGP